MRTMEAQKQWEITKGHLRSSVAICGSTFGGDDGGKKYEVFSGTVEDFIYTVAGQELHLPPRTRDGK